MKRDIVTRKQSVLEGYKNLKEEKAFKMQEFQNKFETELNGGVFNSVRNSAYSLAPQPMSRKNTNLS